MPEKARGHSRNVSCFQCLLCGRTDYFQGSEPLAVEDARKAGWKHTTKATEDDGRDWICVKHHEPGSYKIFWDKEKNRREVDPAKGGPPMG